MKVALCLYGLFTHHFTDSGEAGYQHIKERVIDKVDSVDVFLHSWSTAERERILELYKPKSYEIEQQKSFWSNVNGVSHKDFLYSNERDKFYLFRTFSFMYTRKRALELCKEWMDKTGTNYDAIVVTRFDAGQRDREANSEHHVSRIAFDPQMPTEYIYSAFYNQLNAGFADQWFWSKPENILPLSKMYDRLSEYLVVGSEYEKAVTTCWPDSCWFSHPSVSDPRQFTNEALKPEENKAEKLMAYPRWECVNNHILHKWFFIEQELYGKARFLVG